MICEKFLRGMQMSDGVGEAQIWARELVRREMRGPGDVGNAMRRLGQRYGIEYSVLYSLRYRPPKDIVVSVYERLRAAYLAECDRQERLLRHERKITESKGLIAASLMRAADALGGSTD